MEFTEKHSMDKVIEEFKNIMTNNELRKKYIVSIVNKINYIIDNNRYFTKTSSQGSYGTSHIHTIFGNISLNENITKTKTTITYDDRIIKFDFKMYSYRFVNDKKGIEILRRNNTYDRNINKQRHYIDTCDLTVPELKECCKINNIKINSKMKKLDLIKLLMKI
jgi:hypothetical protein